MSETRKALQDLVQVLNGRNYPDGLVEAVHAAEAALAQEAPASQPAPMPLEPVAPLQALRDTLQKLAKETDAGWSPDALTYLQKAIVFAGWLATPSVAAQPGCRSVPVEPTDDMLDAAKSAMDNATEGEWAPKRADVRAMWAAMLATAPISAQPPSAPPAETLLESHLNYTSQVLRAQPPSLDAVDAARWQWQREEGLHIGHGESERWIRGAEADAYADAAMKEPK